MPEAAGSLAGYERIFVAGHRGLVGSALVRALNARGRSVLTQTRDDLDLADAHAVKRWFRRAKHDLVFLAAAKVGGIRANDVMRWEFLYDNLAIETSVLSAALETGTERVVFFGSSCIYPRLAPQPIKEEYLLTGPLEPTNEPYAIAKIAGLKLVEAANGQYGRRWLSLMPTNLYGPGDNFDLETSHVLPAMIRKFHNGKVMRDAGEDSSVVLWGTGTARRELLHVDDLADAAIHVANSNATGLMNVGFGNDLTIAEIAKLVADIIGFVGPVEWDTSKPDGTPRKLIDSSRIRATGWVPARSLAQGIKDAYAWYLARLYGGEAARVLSTESERVG